MLSGTWPTLGGSEEIGLIADWMLVSNWVNSVARNFMIFFFFWPQADLAVSRGYFGSLN